MEREKALQVPGLRVGEDALVLGAQRRQLPHRLHVPPPAGRQAHHVAGVVPGQEAADPSAQIGEHRLALVLVDAPPRRGRRLELPLLDCLGELAAQPLDLHEEVHRLPGAVLQAVAKNPDLALRARQLAAQLLKLRGQGGDGIGFGHVISASGSGSGSGISPSVSTDSHHCRHAASVRSISSGVARRVVIRPPVPDSDPGIGRALRPGKTASGSGEVLTAGHLPYQRAGRNR